MKYITSGEYSLPRPAGVDGKIPYYGGGEGVIVLGRVSCSRKSWAPTQAPADAGLGHGRGQDSACHQEISSPAASRQEISPRAPF